MPLTTLSPLRPGPFRRGAVPTHVSRLIAATPFIAIGAPPPQVAYIPAQLSYWGNDRYGICVTAEEAFAKGCQPDANPAGVFIPEATCIAWARSHGVLNGASLDGVLADMRAKGFALGSQLYNIGDYRGVNFANESILQSAIGVGPVKIAINANALPSGAGSVQGWYVLGDNSNNNTDHCVAICGFGTADYLYGRLELPRPTALSANQAGYLLFSWSTIGFVDHEWIMGCTNEAWVRSPTTVGVPPLPIPGPGPGPLPVANPPITGTIQVAEGSYISGVVTLQLSATTPPGKYQYIVVPDGSGAFKMVALVPA